MKAVLLALAACACPQKQAATPAPAPSKPVATTPTCDGVRGKVEMAYRTEAQQKEPKRVDEATADNTQMVMTECAKTPTIATCLDGAATVPEIEKCLPPLDPEGTEGERL